MHCIRVLVWTKQHTTTLYHFRLLSKETINIYRHLKDIVITTCSYAEQNFYINPTTKGILIQKKKLATSYCSSCKKQTYLRDWKRKICPKAVQTYSLKHTLTPSENLKHNACHKLRNLVLRNLCIVVFLFFISY